MSPFEFYFTIINIVLLFIMFIWSYFIDYTYNKVNSELMKMKNEVGKMKEDIKNDEKFYKSVVKNLLEFHAVLSHKVIYNTEKIEKDEKDEKGYKFLEKYLSYFFKKKKDVVIKNLPSPIIISTPPPQIPVIQVTIPENSSNG